MSLKFKINEDEQFRRLASHVKPSHYKLTIKPDFETLQFSGHVSIDLQVLEQTSSIELNSLDLDFLRIQLNSPRQGELFNV